MELISKLSCSFTFLLLLLSSTAAAISGTRDQASALAAWRSARINSWSGISGTRDQASALAAWRSARINSWSAISGTRDQASARRSSRINSWSTPARDDVVRKLPGQPDLKSPFFKQFGGYITVDESKGRSLYYYFAEAAEDPASKPLLLWLNGGPGCSSLLGAMVEIGPFGVNPDGKTLYQREFAWNKLANTLFLESPAGVGFSYSNTSSDYEKSGDTRTAEDAYAFLINWFQRFPHYKKREFYIAGESYAGHYIPELANVILKRNMNVDFKIQLKGIMIGNGLINEPTDIRGNIDFLWSHALISDEAYQVLIGNCSDNCANFKGFDIGNLDPYNIYAPVCNSSLEPVKLKWHLGYDPCESNYIIDYLNLPEVQKALNANKTKLPYKWEVCSSLVGEHWDRKDNPSTMFPIYRRLMSSGLRILLYSGDVDSIVPVTSTRYSIAAMGLKVLKPWIPWYGDSQEVAGYRVVYKGLGFATVRGAGHLVPQSQPDRAFALLKQFLHDDL